MSETTLKTGSDNKRKQLERFFAVADRMERRAKKDPEYARQILREIGYYEIMGLPDPSNRSSVSKPREATSRKGAPTKRKSTKTMR